MPSFGMFSSSIAALNGHSTSLAAIGDNIANVNTVGFKGSSAVFGDLFSHVLHNGSTTSQLGGGTELSGVIQSFGQGAIESSTNALDIAIDGSGFFITSPPATDGQFYTRNGQFRMNDNGKVESMTGEVLKGYKITNEVQATELSDIDLAGVQSKPSASTYFNLGTQLNASATAASTFSSPITYYNSIGSTNTLNLTFTKAATGNTWTFAATSSEGTISAGASGSVTFDTTLEHRGKDIHIRLFPVYSSDTTLFSSSM